MRVDVEPRDHVIVFFLDQQPFVPFASGPPLDVHEREIALQPLPFQPELEVAFRQHGGGFFLCARNVFAVNRHRR